MAKNFSIYFCYLLVQYIRATECIEPDFENNTYSIYIPSDEMVEIVDLHGNFLKQAVFVTFFESLWQNIEHSKRIWDFEVAKPFKNVYFKVSFTIYGTPLSGSLKVGVDDMVFVSDDKMNIDCRPPDHITIRTCDISSYLRSGENTFFFRAFNNGGPAGLVFRFDIEATY